MICVGDPVPYYVGSYTDGVCNCFVLDSCCYFIFMQEGSWVETVNSTLCFQQMAAVP